MVEVFRRGDDTAYREWLAAHPDAYVVNIGASGRTGHTVIHRTTCEWIKELHGQGRTHGDQWAKWCCASEAELQERVEDTRGTPAERCKALGVGCWL